MKKTKKVAKHRQQEEDLPAIVVTQDGIHPRGKVQCFLCLGCQQPMYPHNYLIEYDGTGYGVSFYCEGCDRIVRVNVGLKIYVL